MVSVDSTDATLGSVAIVVADFYQDIADHLVSGAQSVLESNGFANVPIFRVPGALELPVIVKALSDTQSYSAIICLGAVIRGETPHFDIVINQSARGLMDVSIASGIPVLNGVLTVETRDQAYERLGGKHGHKGVDVAEAALRMIQLMANIS